MKQTIILFALLSLAVISGCKKTGEGAGAFIVQNYLGTVTIQGPGGNRLPEIGGPVSEGDTVMTAGKSSVDLVYEESSLIRINEKTTVRIDSLMKQVKNSTEVSLTGGSIFTTVQKLKADENFRVNTRTMVVAVRGTSFGVTADANSSQTEVLAGTVKVNPVQDGAVVSDVVTEVKENNRAEIRKDQLRELLRDRKIAVAGIRAERMKKLRADLGEIDGAVVDRLNPRLREEFRMKLLRMKRERFEVMESQRDERVKKFLEMKKERGARIRERFAERAGTKEGRKALLKEWREKRESAVKERLEKRKAVIDKELDKKQEAREKLLEKRKELMEERDAIIEERRRAGREGVEKPGPDQRREKLKKMLEKRKKSEAEAPVSL
ncbi:MAG: FecR domain-containing protein [Spirochaetes bacterium]|nr:FecR domain-containing protein [Spirochaetota bacterium]